MTLDDRNESARRLTRVMRTLGAWIVIVTTFFAWQAIEYRGIVRWIAERQFYEFETYWPTLTVVGLSTVLVLPAVVIVWIIHRREARKSKGQQTGPEADAAQRLLAAAGRLTWLFSVIGIGSLAAAAVCLLLLLMRVPSADTPPLSVVVGSPDAANPVEGPTTLTGSIDVMETAQFNEDLLLVKRTLYFAPVRSGTGWEEPIRYFVEVDRKDLPGTFHEIPFPEKPENAWVWRYRVPTLSLTPFTQGILRRDGLPGEIVNLYRHAGYSVADETYVVFRSRAQIQWRYFMLAAQFGLSALIAGALAFLLRRRESRMRKRLEAALTLTKG